MSEITPEEKVKSLAKELRAIVQTGLAYTKDVFDSDRYKQIQHITNDMLAMVSNSEAAGIDTLLPIETGYATPKIAVRAIILQDDKILMVKEAADHLWTLPGGWCDIGLTAGENAEKEVLEETGLHTKAIRLLALFDQTKYRESITMQHIYTAYFLCSVEKGKLETSIETTDIAYFPVDNLPPLSLDRITQAQFDKAFAVAINQSRPYFD